MAAIITDSFRRESTAALISSINAGVDKFYIGIGKSDLWTTPTDDFPPVPSGNITEKKEALMNLSSLIQVGSTRFVIPYIKFASERRYKAYDPTDPTCFYATTDGGNTTFPCYAMHNNYIYLCLSSTSATVGGLPSSTTYSIFSIGTYTWVMITAYEIGSPFNTAQFTAVVKDPRIGVTETIPANTKGRIYDIAVLEPGSGYTSNIKVNLVGDGSAQDVPIEAVDVTIVGGQITGMSLPAGVFTGYTQASISIERLDAPTVPEPVDAVLIPLITPIDGFADDPVSILPTWFAGLSVDVVGMLDDTTAEDGFLCSYRQISLIKNPESVLDDATGETLDALKYFVLDGPPGDPVVRVSGTVGLSDEVVTDDTTAKCFIDDYKEVDGEHRIYFHQNFSPQVNLKDFPPIGGVTIDGITYTYASVERPEYTHGTGEVLFLENRKPITRAASQTEELKLVIQF
jgi:hypothetical protein